MSRGMRLWLAAAAAGVVLLALTPRAEASPLEDEPGWSCVDDGNRVCGPGNANGVTPGCYDDGGVLVAVWPCEAWEQSDGWRHADGSISYPEGTSARSAEASPQAPLTCPGRLPMINLWTGELSCHKESGPDWDYAYDYTN